MAAGDQIRNGLSFWQDVIRSRTVTDSAAREVLLRQLDVAVARLQTCAHAVPAMLMAPDYALCPTCQWVQHRPTHKWEPVGFGR